MGECRVPLHCRHSQVHWPRVVAADRVLSMGQIEVNCVLMVNWIVLNRTVLDIRRFVNIIIMSRRQRGYPWPFLAISPYHSSPPAGLQGYILCPHIVAVCKFVLVVLLLHIHMWGSTGVHRLWARPCFNYTYFKLNCLKFNLALNNLKRVDMPQNKMKQPTNTIAESYIFLVSCDNM